MQTFTQHHPSNNAWRTHRGKRFTPAMLIGTIVTSLLILVAGAFIVLQPRSASHAAAAAPNGDCTIIVPDQPLTAQGLATPYQLTATNRKMGACHEANAKQAAFVQGAVLDPATGQISIYNPLVVDRGTKPAIAPVVPQLPQGAVVGVWFGFNGNNLTVKGTNGSFVTGQCVNGLNGSVFGQFAYCNAPAFFTAANQAIQAGKLVPPALGIGNDGMACPSVRDFSVVDMDQSDNVTTTYLIANKGRTAQMTAANSAQLQAQNVNVQTNASDNRLLDVGLDGALGCQPWTAPDLADPGNKVPALPLNELQAAAQQAAPVAQVPNGDPMVLNNMKPNLQKVNLYRQGVDQTIVQDAAMSNTANYCRNLLAVAPARLFKDAGLTKGRPSPDLAVGKDLFTFLAQRFNTTWSANGLNCQGLLKTNSPIKVKVDGNGVAIAATLKGQDGTTAPTGNQNGTTPPAGSQNGTTVPTGSQNTSQNGSINCVINATQIQGCADIANINEKNCKFTFDNNLQQVTITCASNNQLSQAPAANPQVQNQTPAQDQVAAQDAQNQDQNQDMPPDNNTNN